MREKHRILIVDDEEDILDLLEYNFTQEGFTVKKLIASSKATFVIHEFRPHLIILDVLMYPYNGIEVCKMIRNSYSEIDPYIFFPTANPCEQ